MNQAPARARTHAGTRADSDVLGRRLLHLEIITTTTARGLTKALSPFIRAVERTRKKGQAGSHPTAADGRLLARTSRFRDGRGPAARHALIPSRSDLRHVSPHGTLSGCLLTATAIYNLRNLSSSLGNSKGARLKRTNSGSPRKTLA